MSTIAKKLAAAQSALAEIEQKLSELAAKREARLLAGDAAGAITRIDDEIATLRRAEQTERDRITLLNKEAEHQEKLAIARRRAGMIDRVEKKLAAADALADELQAAIGQCDALLRKIVKARSELLPVMQLGDAHVNAAVLNPDGCALAPGAIVALLKFEIYRQGARPFVGGTPGAVVEPSYPGGQSPKLEWSLQPDRITPLAKTLRNASAFTVSLLRGESAPIVLELPPEPEPSVTPEQEQAPAPVSAQTDNKEAKLLARLNDLAADPTREAEYMQVERELAALTEGA